MSDISKQLVRVTVTPQLKRFLGEHIRLGNLLTYILMLAGIIDRNRKIAIKALSGASDDDPDLKSKLDQVDEDGAVSALADHFSLMKEMIVCRAVDNYLCYLTDLLSVIFKTRPETLRSNEQIRIDRVLAHNSMAELISYIADKKINELAYQSMTDLKRYLSDKLGFDLFNGDAQERLIIEIIQIRNLLVHNRGKLSEKFLEICPEFEGNIGDEIKLGTNQMFEIVNSLKLSIETIDSLAQAKYNLTETVEFEFREPFMSIRPDSIRPDLA